jgi:hypothetical protein
MMWSDFCDIEIKISNLSEQLVYSDEQTLSEAMDNLGVNTSYLSDIVDEIEYNAFIPLNQIFKVSVLASNNIIIYNEYNSVLQNAEVINGDIGIDIETIRILGYSRISKNVYHVYANLN